MLLMRYWAKLAYGLKRAHSSATSLTNLDERQLVVALTKGPRHEGRDRLELSLVHAGGRLGRRADAQARGDEGAAGVVGDRVAIRRDPRTIEHLLSDFARQFASKSRRSRSIMWFSVPPETMRKPSFASAPPKAWALATIWSV